MTWHFDAFPRALRVRPWLWIIVRIKFLGGMQLQRQNNYLVCCYGVHWKTKANITHTHTLCCVIIDNRQGRMVWWWRRRWWWSHSHDPKFVVLSFLEGEISHFLLLEPAFAGIFLFENFQFSSLFFINTEERVIVRDMDGDRVKCFRWEYRTRVGRLKTANTFPFTTEFWTRLPELAMSLLLCFFIQSLSLWTQEWVSNTIQYNSISNKNEMLWLIDWWVWVKILYFSSHSIPFWRYDKGRRKKHGETLCRCGGSENIFSLCFMDWWITESPEATTAVTTTFFKFK